MIRQLPYSLIGLTAAIASFGLALFFVSLSWTQNTVTSLILSAVSASNLALMCVLIRVWVIEKYPRFRLALEKLPFVRFSVPVPEHLNPSRQAQSAGTNLELNGGNFPINSIAEPEPFTLGTLAFEPPEPIHKVSTHTTQSIQKEKIWPMPPVERSMENAFKKSSRPKIRIPQLEQLHLVCRALKQANQEVAVWTEGELATLANSMLTPRSDVKEMIALLMPARVIRLKIKRTFEFEHHAQVLNNLLIATGQQLPVNFINSSKDDLTGQCIVNFEYLGKPVTWRFLEPANQLSEKFVKNAMIWVGKRASGRFYPLGEDSMQRSYLFLPDAVKETLPSGMLLTKETA